MNKAAIIVAVTAKNIMVILTVSFRISICLVSYVDFVFRISLYQVSRAFCVNFFVLSSP